jgi:hypothetical protein
VVTAAAELQTQVGIDKSLSSLIGDDDDGVSVDFDLLGLIPFHASIKVPVSLSADFSFDGQESVTFGYRLNAFYGDNYKTWTLHDGWDHVKSTPQIIHSPVLEGSKSFTASDGLTVTSGLDFSMDNVFTHTFDVGYNYNANMNVDPTTSKWCMHSLATASAVEHALLHINVPFVQMSLAKEWGPYTRWAWNRTLDNVCNQSMA